ncbi:cytosolic carboxypeptidase 6-like isoform X2 [Arctopsyche grandis]
MWFNFMVDNVKQDQRVIFNIVNFGKSKSLYNGEMTPIVKSSSRPKWQRLMRRNVFYHRSIYHRFRHILSFSFAFDREEDVYHFAMAVPYSYNKLQTYLDLWIRKAKHLKNAVDKQIIGKSVQKKNVDLITIGDEEFVHESLGESKKKEKRKVVVILARTHGGEVPTSFICQGLMDFMISSHGMAQLLRQYITLKIVPMVNPDGVYLGNQRANLLGIDLNRSWHMISQWAHPTMKAVHDTIKNIEAKREHYQLDFVIDMHSHSSLKGCFMYGNTYDDVYRYERHIVFPKVFATKTEGCCPENSLFNADTLKLGTARRFLCTSLGKNTNSFTLQVSMGGYHLPNIPHYIHYNEEAYLRLGRNLGKSLFEYYRQINVIPATSKISDGRTKHSKRKTKKNQIKHLRPKLIRPKPVRHLLEPRIIIPSILEPQINEDNIQVQHKSQTEFLQPKSSKNVSNNQKSIYYLDEMMDKPYSSSSVKPINLSSLPKLAIIDLNNSIRTGLKSSYPRVTYRSKSSTAERRSAKKKRLSKQKLDIATNKIDIFTSDEDYIDTE